MLRTLIAAALLAGGTSLAAAAAAQFWSHKDWRTIAHDTAGGDRECIALTGGDGDDSLEVRAHHGEGVSVYYAEATARGYPTRLADGDDVRFVIEGPATIRFDDVSVSAGIDGDGIPFADAGPADGRVPELVAALRVGARLRVERLDAAVGTGEPLATFSLSGFTASFLKMAEWCGIDPARPNRS